MPSACFAPLPPLRLPSLKLTLSTFLTILSPFMLSLSSHPSHAPLPRLLSRLTALRSLLPPLPARTRLRPPSGAPPAFLVNSSTHTPPTRAPQPRHPSDSSTISSNPQPPNTVRTPPHQPPNPARTHPTAPQEFFGKNSYCARGARSTPLQHPRRPRTLSRSHRRSHVPSQGNPPTRPLAPPGPPTPPPAPPSARSSQASEAWEPAKNPPKPSLASPSPEGTGWRETVPPFTPTLRRRSLVAVSGTMSVRPRPAAPSYPNP